MAKESLISSISKLLEQSQEPLHYEEITKRLIAQNLWKTSGKTPAATVSARLSTELKSKGSASQFIRPKPGCYALNSSPVATPPQIKKSSKQKDVPTKKALHGLSKKSYSFPDVG
jgi:restriction system protein